MMESFVMRAAGAIKHKCQDSPGKFLWKTNMEVLTCQLSFKQAILYCFCFYCMFIFWSSSGEMLNGLLFYSDFLAQLSSSKAPFIDPCTHTHSHTNEKQNTEKGNLTLVDEGHTGSRSVEILSHPCPCVLSTRVKLGQFDFFLRL